MRYIIPAIILLIFGSCFLYATQALHPKINNKTIIGTWEAISTRDSRVYRLDIREKGDSYLSFAVLPFTGVYKLKEKRINNGKVFMSFADTEHDRLIINISGKGVAGKDGEREEGVMDVELIMDPDEKPLNIWKLKFVKTPYIAELYELSLNSKKAIDKYESETKTASLKEAIKKGRELLISKGAIIPGEKVGMLDGDYVVDEKIAWRDKEHDEPKVQEIISKLHNKKKKYWKLTYMPDELTHGKWGIVFIDRTNGEVLDYYVGGEQ